MDHTETFLDDMQDYSDYEVSQDVKVSSHKSYGVLRLVDILVGKEGSSTELGIPSHQLGEGDYDAAGREEAKLSNMRRWRSFRLVLNNWLGKDTIETILSKFIYPTPNLESLELIEADYDHILGPIDTNLLNIPSIFPLFESLKLFSTNLSVDIVHFLHRNPSYTDVHLHALSILAKPDSLRHLSRYPNLEDLSLVIVQPLVGGESLDLPQVGKLTLSGGDLSRLSNHVTVSNLKHLRILHPSYWSSPIATDFKSIQTFEWDVSRFPSNIPTFLRILSNVLAECSQLRELVLWAISWTALTDGMRDAVNQLWEDNPHPTLQRINFLEVGDDHPRLVAITYRNQDGKAVVDDRSSS
ncbi:hypothetical protein FRC14_008191 [Serendipita sp. 396]|nr:hypothetical protein FRC14_008191 [Serendipita sp. 396]